MLAIVTMEQSKLDAAQALKEKIEKTAEILRKWKTAKIDRDLKINITTESLQGIDDTQWVPSCQLSFDVLKTLNIAHFSKELETLQAEFKAL